MDGQAPKIRPADVALPVLAGSGAYFAWVIAEWFRPTWYVALAIAVTVNFLVVLTYVARRRNPPALLWTTSGLVGVAVWLFTHWQMAYSALI